MSDDLVKRLRQGAMTTVGAYELGVQAADRIESLEAALAKADELFDVIDKPDQSDGAKGRYHYNWHKVDDTLRDYRAAREATK